MVITLSWSSISCDRLIILSVTVYEWVNAPLDARSKIYHKEYTTNGLLNEDIPIGMDLQSIVKAAIHYSGRINNRRSYDDTDISDSRGEFRIAISTGQGNDEYITSLEVSMEGYYSAKRDITDRGSSHMLNVILVRK